jgi:hypothetical protein
VTVVVEPPKLAPSPEFRYVGFEPGPSVQTRIAASLFTGGASVVAGWIGELGFKESLVGALLVSAGFAYALRTFGGPTRRLGVRSARLAIVPWGVMVEDDAEPRVLRWAALRRVHLHSVYGNDAGTPSTLWSFIVVETARERFASRTAGAVPLEGLLAHLAAYTHESSARIALDLDGDRPTGGPEEPEVKPLLAAAELALCESPTSSRLHVPAAGYRSSRGASASPETVRVLRAALRDRVSRDIDRRPLAAVLAAELRAGELVPDLLELVQSPHPLVAAVAKAAALRLGAPTSRTGHLDEVAPFLFDEDVAALKAWVLASPVAEAQSRARAADAEAPARATLRAS